MGEDLEERVKKLCEDGLDFWQASKKAQLERNMRNWPSEWGDRILIVVYGDFAAPSEDIVLPALRITIDHNNKRNIKFTAAMCVLDIWIEVEERSIYAVMDALRRLNIFLGIWVLQGGCRACDWYLSLVHGLITAGPSFASTNIGNLDLVCRTVLNLPTHVKQKICAALYWVRSPKNLSMDYYLYEKDLLRVYSSYWNAFECLVDAIEMITPNQSLTPSQKQEKIDEFISERYSIHQKLTAEDIQDCYTSIVNPGFREKAINALTVCFVDPTLYIKECFKMPEKRDNLYQIRNAINHGDIDAENPDEIHRVERRFAKLSHIVLEMFGWFLQAA